MLRFSVSKNQRENMFLKEPKIEKLKFEKRKKERNIELLLSLHSNKSRGRGIGTKSYSS